MARVKPLKKIRQVGEAALLLLAFITIPFFPRCVVLGLAKGLGDLGRVCSPSLRRLGRANLDLAFGASRSDADKVKILRESFRIFALVMLDLFWFAAFTRRRLERLVTFDESIRHYHASRPALIVTGHFGNWEVMGQSSVMLGAPIVSVATPLRNPVAEALMARFRRRTGQEIERRAGAVKAMLTVLRRGGRIAILLDQNTLPHEGGVFVNFFGLPVPVSRAAATLARHTRAAVVIAHSLVGPGGTYRIFTQPPLQLGEVEDAEATQAIVARLEALIREHPGHWLWMYKRWKYVPVGVARERYPYYARAAPGEG